MNLMDWDTYVSPHLQMIEAGAEIALRHAERLPVKPGFETLAQDELAKARKVLEASLQNIIAAQAIYASKPMEGNRAA